MGIISSIPFLVECVSIGVLLLMDKIPLNKICGDTYDQNVFSKLVILVVAYIGISFGIGVGLAALGLKPPLIIAVLASISCKVIMLLFSTITKHSSSPPTPPGGLVGSNVKADGRNDHNPTDHPERREYDGERTERKYQTYATRKKPIIVTDGDKEDRISEEQQLIKGLEDHFTRIENLKTEIPANVDDINKRSFPSH